MAVGADLLMSFLGGMGVGKKRLRRSMWTQLRKGNKGMGLGFKALASVFTDQVAALNKCLWSVVN